MTNALGEGKRGGKKNHIQLLFSLFCPNKQTNEALLIGSAEQPKLLNMSG